MYAAIYWNSTQTVLEPKLSAVVEYQSVQSNITETIIVHKKYTCLNCPCMSDGKNPNFHMIYNIHFI